ncbi:MAG: NAD(P)-dependent oxidoreductase [Candidatus Hydrogenedentes bacterium]|nr:NAD(P)-dependent oxidoreductase [Candidatus Hydrogenedentota bacterium]
MNILITGGTGFLGGHLIPLLQKDDAHTLYGLARSEKARDTLEKQGVNAVVADLTDSGEIREALKDISIEVVFHLAAEIASQRSKELLRSVNIEGTQNLFDAIKTHPELKSFIFASTVVTGEADGALLTEEVPLVVHTEYGHTKQTAERILLDAFTREDFPAIVVRPCHIYGNGGWFGGVIHELEKGSLRMPGNGKNMWDVIHVDDCAAAFVTVMTLGQPGQIYHVADDTPITMGEFMAETARQAGVKPPGRAPRFLANLMLGRDTITSVMRSARTSNAKLRALGWRPACPDYTTGLAKTFRNKV